ncbi:MAG: hypothetical protein JO263_01445 [Candidatus Eremiobacteraeota bacterium]|nr:hypothetical protein [Candidatus Eremiobacteraeota bacterium]
MSHNFGNTTNFEVDSTDGFWGGLSATQQSNVKANANFLLGQVEAAFTTTTGWFGTDTTKFGTSNRQQVLLDLVDNSGANNSGYGNPINEDSQSNNSSSTGGPIVSMLWMAEWSEVLMSLTSTWHAGDSSGEGLSQFCNILLFQAGHYDYYSSFVDNWLNGGQAWSANNKKFVASPNSARSDWVNQTFTGITTGAGDQIHGDGDFVSFGCALAFLFYLNTQLNFTQNQIIGAYSGTMASAYNALTGDPGDPFPFFLALISNVFPASQTAAIPGPVTDNPFPLGLLSFWCNNNTFSSDQAKDIVATQGGVVSNAFYLVLEGFSIDSFNALGVTVPTPTGSFANLSGIKIQPTPSTPGPIFEDPTNTKIPQRIRFSFDIVFTDESAFPNPGNPPVTAVLNGLAQIGGTNVSGATASLGFELLGGANPYFTNLDPSNAADLAYLSQDLRVFSVIAGQAPLSGAPAFTSDAYGSIQNFIQFLNGSTTYTQPSATDLLDNLPGQTGFETADSSVTPTDGAGHTAYNFAVARVRLRGASLDQANNCRVFFRLFVAQSADTDFQPSTTYLSTQGTSGADAGHPVFPLASAQTTDPSGQTLQTTPYFATDINGTHDYDGTTANANIRNVQIPNGGDQIWAYYGCFLDIYDASGNANLGGTHHCIVAEIAYSLAPIPTTTATGATPNPLIWDQLAQRNLQITLSENPKSSATHVIPQAFDLRPSKALIPLPGQPVAYPDELMIDWGNTPPGSVATIYWPGLNSSKVLALASSLYASHLLSAADGHTIQCTTTRGVTYIPIPHLPNVNLAGLLTIDLPDTVTQGQAFNIVVRRVSSRRAHLRPPPPPPAQLKSMPSKHSVPQFKVKAIAPTAVVEKPPPGFTWRQVCGAFNVRIPVTNAKKMLPLEEDTLAIIKWRLETKPSPYRWRPIWQRLIELVGARVKGLGGDPHQIPPSLGGFPGKGRHGHPEPHPGHGEGRDRDSVTGKICGVCYDRFGDFEGFDLRPERGEERRYRAREEEIERLVLEAWRERWVVTVESEPREHRERREDHDRDAPPWVARIVLRRTGS